MMSIMSFFFRMMTSKVSNWFTQHSTMNPKVPIPEGVIVVEKDSFELFENAEQMQNLFVYDTGGYKLCIMNFKVNC